MAADFAEAQQLLERKEGIGAAGYSDLPHDRGGETCNGISRAMWPKASIWPVVDELKSGPNFPGVLSVDPRVKALTLQFYKAAFWDALGLDHCIVQAVANELYEQAVNMGLRRAGANLQEALNFVNRKAAGDQVVNLWADIIVDGRPGPVTHAAVASCYRAGRAPALYDWMNVLQGEDLAVFMRNNPDQRVFAPGLVRRVETRTHF